MPAIASPTLEKLLPLLAAHSSTPAKSIGTLDTLVSLGIDSLAHIQLILDVEDAFEIEIPEEEANGIRTVAALFDAIQRAQDAAFSPITSNS